jgi:hypothetical protein
MNMAPTINILAVFIIVPKQCAKKYHSPSHCMSISEEFAAEIEGPMARAWNCCLVNEYKSTL